MYMIMTYSAIYRKLISYHTGWYCRNLPYQCLGRYRNAFVSFRFKYRLYRSCFGHIGINTVFRQENRYQTKQKKKTQKTPQISRSTSSLLPWFFLLFFVFVSTTHFFFFSFILPTSISTAPSSSSFISQRVSVSLFCFGTLT